MNQVTPRPLNQGQKEAAEAFFQFLFTDEREFNISGPGGVGKTHLMGYLIDTILPRYHETCQMMGLKPEYDFVEMTATTNKAAEALGQATGRPTSTIQSFLNLKVTEDFATGETKLTKTGAWRVHERVILFVDEASMADTPLDTCIQEGLHKSKIVYVGDHCQLAPVKETISPIYRRPMPFYELTEPMRTTIPELQALNAQLRKTVETGDFQPIQIVPGIIDWLDDQDMQDALTHVFAKQTHSSRILAYTNKRVVQFNDFIRQIRQLPDEPTLGEILVNNSAIKLSRRMLSVEEEVEIVAQASKTEQVTIDNSLEHGVTTLEVRRTDIRTNLGEVFKDVPLPIDRDHFEGLAKYFKSRKNWNRYFHLKNNYPDFRPRDAGTVYKAQGSTYDSVFIDLGDISTCRNPAQAARLLYVAASRARLRIFLYGDLSDKYGGLIQ